MNNKKIGYGEDLQLNLTTLSTANAQTLDGHIRGLLYVPDVTNVPSCNVQQYDYIPTNVTRRPQLPPTNYNLIALAPWFSQDCTLAYLSAARFDPIRAFIFYKTNSSTDKPPDVDSDVWDLNDDGAWRDSNFPIFAVPTVQGENMMSKLSLYSGSVTQVPNATEIMQRFGPNANDYIRIWTELTLKSSSSLTKLWVYFLIVIGALLFIVAVVSVAMHFIQRRRRASLRRRVQLGEVDLEAMGIKRLTVPVAHVQRFALFTYTSDPEITTMPATPNSETFSSMARSTRSSRRRPQLEHRSPSSDIITTCTTLTVRSKRSALSGNSDTMATNYQPQCHICLDSYEDRLTIIRELPCHHIFHPVCIDEFLTRNSSLCPVCKQCMLPRGYSPKITNSMVRRERALRRLQERVDFDVSSIESRASKKGWSKFFFHHSSTTPESNDLHMTTFDANKTKPQSPETSTNESTSPAESSPTEEIPVDETPTEPTTTNSPPKPTPAKKPRPRKSRPRAISVLPTQPEGIVLKTIGAVGRHSPSSFARERMREIADKNAPFEDPDLSRPICKTKDFQFD